VTGRHADVTGRHAGLDPASTAYYASAMAHTTRPAAHFGTELLCFGNGAHHPARRPLRN
jgi:hypothetical protein